MGAVHIIHGEFNRKLDLVIVPEIKAGFPSPAEDYMHDTLDFNRDECIRRSSSFGGMGCPSRSL